MQVFGSRAVAYLPKELRQGAEQPDTRQYMTLYLGMADEVGNGQRLEAYYTNVIGVVLLMGQVFEWKTKDVTNFPDELPLRRPVGPGATTAQLEADMGLPGPRPSDVYVVKETLQSRTVDGAERYKAHWGGYAKRDATWRPPERLTGRGADALVAAAESGLKQRGRALG